MRIDILTLFPEMFGPVLGASILGRASAGEHVEYHLHDIREHAEGRHRKVDDRPFGGGPGMVMMCQPLYDCVQSVERMETERFGAPKRILLTPQGEPLRQKRVEELATASRLLLIAGHYEGIDERVIEALDPVQISIGDYVLSGGELPAMVLVDAIVRLLPGVLGHEDSAAQDSFTEVEWTGGQRVLEGPHYTRPREWEGRTVPDVLLSGDHEAVERWRRERMLERTRRVRPDLITETPSKKPEP